MFVKRHRQLNQQRFRRLQQHRKLVLITMKAVLVGLLLENAKQTQITCYQNVRKVVTYVNRCQQYRQQIIKRHQLHQLHQQHQQYQVCIQHFRRKQRKQQQSFQQLLD